jgi:hypothetical protein
VQHHDPARHGLVGAPTARFFVSVRHGTTVWLQAHATIAAALAVVSATLPADL